MKVRYEIGDGFSYVPVERNARRAEMFESQKPVEEPARLAGMPKRFDMFDVVMAVVLIFIPICILFIGGLWWG